MDTNGLDVDFVSFVRYSTSTHSTNTDQRLVELQILGRTADKLYVRAPRDGAMGPPGNWFIFALNKGKPSVAKTILLKAGAPTNVDVPQDASSNVPGSASTTFVSTILMSLAALFVL